VLPPAKLLERLERRLPLLTTGRRDAPERQRTLRATIEWSYGLLTDEEKRLFARLPVFAGSFSLEAAERVCQADIDTLGSLVDQSLLRETDDGRFMFLETIREYGLDRLDESGEAAELRQRHAYWALALASEAATEFDWADQVRSFDAVESDHDNLREALAWAQADPPAHGASPRVLPLALLVCPRLSCRGAAMAPARTRDLRQERSAGAVARTRQRTRRHLDAHNLALVAQHQGRYEDAIALLRATRVNTLRLPGAHRRSSWHALTRC